MSSETAFTAALAQHRAVAIMRASSRDHAAAAMWTAVEAGFRVVEFTVTTPGAMSLVAEFARDARLTVGVGTVMDPETAGEAVRAGARFLVSPVLDERVVACARALGVAAVPGCFTPTELWRAHAAGAAAQKLFPAPGDVAAFVRSVLGPLPFLTLVPTNGVDAANAAAVLQAGAVGVGFTTPLFAPTLVQSGDLAAIGERATALLAAVRSAAA
ncbi:bifunctional 4-hydroxy-2-oxoglutarate aldolase/2-dehydro-3-deoxy-phosphogluconate aldolase [Nannocystis sp. SCPEA4]|uniref:bifunctional 4-hydroxy-2-oxoglutarate aldolase/2-dehydro-3-deoxy-phosphogluconate aldolase n=1 Tax=Nannocystis sp. SCPEA4 TaxID=2996787 RepID=UPI00226EA2B8|nr:bifunctional 4-hydroxy-2-oxoglutarate aldolase/2-dehydro-3-deoxy-phosphogluconate aldolase [Nannocystis sp. SCPEA4]MCY1057204.1 bifunctional 4-hydroxy-2-oxoglutarate aldolase/2-dehydro-3-deoxy-phosphogluconate aldolase [Nannocystis sp. SCPEA4]